MKVVFGLIKTVFIITIICCLNFSFSYAQDLRLTNQNGVVFRSKPSLSQRLSGVKEIYVFYPNNSAQANKYVYQNFIVYLQRLGLKVIDHGVRYEQQNLSQNQVAALALNCKDDIANYVDGINVMVVVINILHILSPQAGEETIGNFAFWDPINNFTWSYRITLASSAERYIKQCQSTICSSYSYNPAYSYQPPYISTNYSMSLLRSYLDKGNYSPIEGIYEGDNYTVGVKKGIDGTFYLLYHSSKNGASGWKDGNVKAQMRETSTPGIYRATWYGLYYNKMDFKIIFENGMLTTYDENNDKEIYLKMYPSSKMESETVSKSNEWSGTGFALKNGYIVTNFHVVDGAKSILVHGVNGDTSNGYVANVVATDKTNDLAIIQIKDSRFTGFGSIPYTIRSQMADVGEDIWVLGYPLTQVLGNEIKLTNGLISSRSGYQGDISSYQISAPVQPGNSGGPLFDSKGNIVGIVNAGVAGAENVGYAIKTSYLKNLVDSYSLSSSMPTSNTISSLALKDQVKKVNNYVFLLLCSSK